MTKNCFAVWDVNCWKCNTRLPVAMRLVVESGFSPSAVKRGAWRDEEGSLKTLNERYHINLSFRETAQMPLGYMANICPECDSVQGDFYLRKQLLEAISGKSEWIGRVVEHSDSGRLLREFDSLENASFYYNLLDCGKRRSKW